MSQGVTTDRWSRSKSVLAMAAGVASKELKHRVRAGLASTAERVASSELRTRIEQAALLAENLGRLKGAFMKAGQMLSLDASDFLPPEAADILTKLQGQAEPVDFAVIRGVLESELGPALARLEALEEMPAASASIGQVHRARVDGRPVAIKVQYPGIAESIDADIGLLEKVGTSWLSMTRRPIDVNQVFEELRTILHLEADYERERHYLERFAVHLASEPRFELPRPLADLSTKRVLTMTWEDGLPLGQWIATGPTRAARESIGRALLDLYCLEFFEWGMVQTDPNYGNFLVRGDDRTLCLLDFGATVEYEPEFRAGYVDILRTVARDDADAIVEAGIAFELLDPREPKETRALFAAMMRSSMEPFERQNQPFVFRDADYAARSRDVGMAFVRSLRFSPPPRRLLFLHRKLGGLFQLLRRLDLRLDLVPYWDRMVQR
ncbi:MAG: AarF/ABC1/UbiB kinase family protein [Deltaproteobacteria bacterium]|nr:AarF/ABC1/UbiB kinase family protein [Deltaproteobacteria bacterium]